MIYFLLLLFFLSLAYKGWENATIFRGTRGTQHVSVHKGVLKSVIGQFIKCYIWRHEGLSPATSYKKTISRTLDYKQ